MNSQKIHFNNQDVEVQGCYPYLENTQTGKVVLVITANKEDATAADLEALADNETGLIEYYTRTINVDETTGEPVAGEWQLKQVYDKYNSGEIRTSYQNGVRECRVTRVDGTVAEVAKLRADIDFVALMTDVDLDD